MPVFAKWLIAIFACLLSGLCGYQLHKHKKDIKRARLGIKNSIKAKVARW